MTSEELKRQVYWLTETIPSAERRRTARGVLRTCRELQSHKARAEKLLAEAQTETDRATVESLISRIEARHAELMDGGNLITQWREERALRSAGMSANH